MFVCVCAATTRGRRRAASRSSTRPFSLSTSRGRTCRPSSRASLMRPSSFERSSDVGRSSTLRLEVVDAAGQVALDAGQVGGGLRLAARRRPCSPGSARSRRAPSRPPPTRRRRRASGGAPRMLAERRGPVVLDVGRHVAAPAGRLAASGRHHEVLLPRRGDRRRGHVDEDRRVRRLRGARRAPCSPASGSRSPLRRLHGAQQVTMFSHVDGPPFERGITWSTVRLPRSWPQYWQVQRSRAKTARRVILRRCASRGIRT